MSSLFALLVLCVFAFTTAEEIPNRLIWFDSSCSQRVQNDVWIEVDRMATSAGLSLFQSAKSDGQRLFGYIFKTTDGETQQFIDGPLASPKSTPNVLTQNR